MTDKWKKSFQKKLADYESPVPEDLWEDVMSDMNKLRIKRIRTRQIMYAIGSVAVAAASLLLLITFVAKNDIEKFPVKYKHINATVSDAKYEKIENNISTLAKKKNNLLAINVKSKGSNNIVSAADLYSDTVSTMKESSGPVDERDTVKKVTGERNNTVSGNKNSSKSNSKSRSSYYYDNTNNSIHNEKHKIGFNLSMQNTFMGLLSNNSGNDLSAARGMDLYDYAFSYAAKAVGLQNNEIKMTAHHHQPIRAGLSIAIPISERLSFETGLAYSYHTSDIERSVGGRVSEGTQRLHYIGIPLKSLYNIWISKNISFYVSGGTKVEKMIYGQQKIDGENHKITINPLQWSINIGTGIEYKINNKVGIYAEPGVSYYFNNNSNVPTIYNDKPWNPELSFGIRVIK